MSDGSDDLAAVIETALESQADVMRAALLASRVSGITEGRQQVFDALQGWIDENRQNIGAAPPATEEPEVIALATDESAADPNPPLSADSPIEVLGLQGRGYKALVREGYRTVRELLLAPDEVLKDIRGFGGVSKDDLDDKLKAAGLRRGPLFATIDDLDVPVDRKRSLRYAGHNTLAMLARRDDSLLRSHGFNDEEIALTRRVIKAAGYKA